MTCLVEDITIKVTLNHCEGDSDVLGGPNNLRERAFDVVNEALDEWLENRCLGYTHNFPGVSVTLDATGLYEAPEVGGGDN